MYKREAFYVTLSFCSGFLLVSVHKSSPQPYFKTPPPSQASVKAGLDEWRESSLPQTLAAFVSLRKIQALVVIG